MAMQLLSRLRKLQEFLREEGFGGSVLALPAPKLMLLPSPTAEESTEELLFSRIVSEPEIIDVSKDLFESGFFNQAVEEAFKALDSFLKDKSGLKRHSGVNLVNNAFSPNKPILAWSERSTVSEEDEHKGYHLIYQGSFLGIRNPVSHEINWIADHTSALDAILLAQHLLRRAKISKRVETEPVEDR